MILNKNVLILEDNHRVLSALLRHIDDLEHKQPYSLSVMVLTNHEQVQTFINDTDYKDFDIILIDRDCKLNGSFHVLDINRFGVDKIIAISSVPEYNARLKEQGVTRIVEKELSDIDGFAKKAVGVIEQMITPERLLNFGKK